MHVGHVSNTTNLAYLVEILKWGCNIAFDTIGLHWAFSDDVITGEVTGFVALGYQILLSHV